MVMAEVAEQLDDTPAQSCIFADDLAILCTEDTLEETNDAMQRVLTHLEQRLPDLGLNISRDKTFIMPVTEKDDKRGIRQTDVEVRYADGSKVKRASAIRYLGVTLDDALTMSEHLKDVRAKFLRRLSLIQLLAGKDWGCDAHTLRQTYLTYVLPTLTYAIAVWGPVLLRKELDTLEVLHRRAARVITGCNLYTEERDLL